MEVGAFADDDEAVQAGIDGGALAGPAIPEIGTAFAAKEADFEGAGDVSTIAEGRACGFEGIEAAEFLDKGIERAGIELGTQFRIARGEGIGAVGEEFQVEPGAAGHHGRAAAVEDFLDDREGELAVAHGIAGFGGIKHAEEVVGAKIGFGRCRSGDEGFETAVQLKGIGIHDLSADAGGELRGEAGLARGGGAAKVDGLG
jgi:hypothetical protein